MEMNMMKRKGRTGFGVKRKLTNVSELGYLVKMDALLSDVWQQGRMAVGRRQS